VGQGRRLPEPGHQVQQQGPWPCCWRDVIVCSC
jgi:hypothetical protein